MKIRIDGRELVVRKPVRVLIELQQATGWKMEDLDKKVSETDSVGIAIAAFCALRNAGIPTTWEEVLERDVEDYEPVEEPGDDREDTDASDPPRSPSDSDPGGAEPEPEAATNP